MKVCDFGLKHAGRSTRLVAVCPRVCVCVSKAASRGSGEHNFFSAVNGHLLGSGFSTERLQASHVMCDSHRFGGCDVASKVAFLVILQGVKEWREALPFSMQEPCVYRHPTHAFVVHDDDQQLLGY